MERVEAEARRGRLAGSVRFFFPCGDRKIREPETVEMWGAGGSEFLL